MTNTNETITDIIAEMRALSYSTSDGIIAINGRSISDRLEVAWKREKATAEKSSTVGDTAKLREALLRCDAIAQLPEVRNEQSIKDMRNIIKHALAAPPRNCDKYSHDEALRIWSAEPENPMNGCFDVWLYAPATEQKGDAK